MREPRRGFPVLLNVIVRSIVFLATALALSACLTNAGITPPAAIPAADSASGAQIASNSAGLAQPSDVRRACPISMSADYAECFALYQTDVGADMRGYVPADLQSAYQLPSATSGSGQTVALVEAFDDPEAESDLAVYRSTFGMPECSSANGCFRKVNQLGQPTPLPRPNPGWGVETSLDLDMIAAGCPNCSVLLVEADDERSRNLAKAADRAAKMRVDVISNSYGALGNIKTWGLYKFYYHEHPVIRCIGRRQQIRRTNSGRFPGNVVSVGVRRGSAPGNGRGWRKRSGMDPEAAALPRH